MTKNLETAGTASRLTDPLPAEFFESAPDATLIVNPAGVVMHSNRRARTMFAGEELVGADTSRLGISADDGVALVRNGGKLLAIDVVARQIQLGHESWQLLVLRDSPSVPAERDLTRAWKNLALGEINNSLAHELNQPLAAVTLHCEAAAAAAEDAGNADPELLAELQRATAQAFRASNVVTRLRQLFVFDIGATVAARPNMLVQDAVRGFVAHSGPKDISSRLAAGLPPVEVNAGLIVQALISLMGNAASLAQSEHGSIEIATEQGAGEVCISITGAGLQLDTDAQRFSPLKDRHASWAGLEFAICRRVIAAHGGRLEVSGQCCAGGKGCFCVRLPAQVREQ